MPWPPKRLDLVGVELEGGWEKAPAHEMVTDVSVHVRANYVGEVASAPMPAEDVLDWMVRRDIYPDVGDPTCGLHVHVSVLDNTDYARMMEDDFYTDFIAAMSKWGKEKRVPKTDEFWPRLYGENRFCRAEFRPMNQYRDGRKTEGRRTHLNYGALAAHGTMECRMLPMFRSPRIARSAVKAYLIFVDDWLVKHGDEEFKAVAASTQPFDSTPEVITINRQIECA
jgi:hypothetical protein